MRAIARIGALALLICGFLPVEGFCETRFEMTGIRRVTHAPGDSHTSRGNPTCICTDDNGVNHLVWEDKRSGNFEIYYAFVRNDTLSRELRITHTPADSDFPCIACCSGSVYLLWREVAGHNSQIVYARIENGQVAAKTELTESATAASCPVAAADGDGTLHVAWHEGPFKKTGIVYGRVSGDSLVHREEIPAEDPTAFRPDIACDGEGRVMVTWSEEFDIMSVLWDGRAWGEQQVVYAGYSQTWRHSVAYMGSGVWGISWFDRLESGDYYVYAALFDGEKWYGSTVMNETGLGYYPNTCRGPDNTLMVVWEGKSRETGDYSMRIRLFDGKRWNSPQSLLSGPSMLRYPSLSLDENGDFPAIWFSDGRGNYEVFYGILRRERR